MQISHRIARRKELLFLKLKTNGGKTLVQK
jgi:hypothetical protein